MEYKWENAQEEDFRAGIITMFVCCVVSLFAIIGWVFVTMDSSTDSKATMQASSGSGKSRSSATKR